MDRSRRAFRGRGWIPVAILAVALGAVPAGAQSPFRVTASVEPEGPLSDTEPVRLVIRIQGSEQPEVSVPHLPEMKNLRVVMGPSTADEFSWVNGKTSATKTLTYTLLAEEPGPAEIPAIEVRIGSEIYRTDPIRLEVAGGTRGAPSPSGPRRAGRAETSQAADAFLEAKVTAGEVWLSQPVTLTVSLYTDLDVRGFQWVESPDLSGFWTEDVPVDPNNERYRTKVKGRDYVAYPLIKKILIPTAPGEVAIEPFVAQLQVRSTRGDRLSDLFWRPVQELVRKTAPLKLRVRRLPDAGRPDGFSGAVGTFRMRVSLDRQDVQVNDAVALKVVVDGDGFLRSAEAPRLDAPPDLKVFEPKISESISTKDGKVVSRKIWEWLLVPLTPGEIRLPPVRFSFFDPARENYREVHNDPLVLTVRRAEHAPESGLARGDVRLQRREIAFIKPLRGRLAEGEARIHRRPYFVALLLAPLVLLPALILAGRRRARLLRDQGLARSGRARSRARKRLRATERRMNGLDPATFHEEVARALVDYAGDRFNRSAAGLTYDLADELLESRGVDAALRGRFRTCLETCDFARFVPDSGQVAHKQQIVREAIELVERLEKVI